MHLSTDGTPFMGNKALRANREDFILQAIITPMRALWNIFSLMA